MAEPRFEITEEVLQALRENGLPEPLVSALTRLLGWGCDEEREFLDALFALQPPPASDALVGQILRTADRRFRGAVRLLGLAYRDQMAGRLEDAVAQYRQSIALFPTAEAHTFLGWTYSRQGRYAEAIAECERAIAADPGFGNPYNDIGSYLMSLGRPAEAIPWLEKAIAAPRYDPRHFPWLNLGRVHEALGQPQRALVCYVKAGEIAPDDPTAQEAIARLSGPPPVLN
jgi:tetratricopeptide (TPR) repeat protein